MNSVIGIFNITNLFRRYVGFASTEIYQNLSAESCVKMSHSDEIQIESKSVPQQRFLFRF